MSINYSSKKKNYFEKKNQNNKYEEKKNRKISEKEQDEISKRIYHLVRNKVNIPNNNKFY